VGRAGRLHHRPADAGARQRDREVGRLTLVTGEEEAGWPRAGDQPAERAELPAGGQRLAQRGEHRQRRGLQVVAERGAEPAGVPGPQRRHQLGRQLRFADRLVAAEPVKRAVHGRGGQRAVGQRQHPVVGHGRDQRLGELLAPAAPDRRAADDGEGHVAADPAGDLAQVLLRQLGLPERVAGDEGGGGVRATARKTAGDRYPFADRDGRPAQAFTPDFYLPAYDLYIEITTLNQKLVTKKNRKARRLRERHPEIQIRVLYQRDYLHLLVKYGLEPPSQLATPEELASIPMIRLGPLRARPASDATAESA